METMSDFAPTRRIFCLLFASAASFSAIPAYGANAILFERVSESTVIARGNPDDLVAFMYRYQDALWPEWREDEATVERYRVHETHAREFSAIYVNVGCRFTQAAFVESIR